MINVLKKIESTAILRGSRINKVHRPKATANKNKAHSTYWVLASCCKVSWNSTEAVDLALDNILQYFRSNLRLERALELCSESEMGRRDQNYLTFDVTSSLWFCLKVISQVEKCLNNPATPTGRLITAYRNAK